MLKWCYFVLVAAFLGAVLWMLNDVRLRVNALFDPLDEKLPPLMTNTERAVQRINEQLPRILKNTEQATSWVNTQLPQMLNNTEQMAGDIRKRLPQLLTKAEEGVDRLRALTQSLDRLREVFRPAKTGPTP